MEADRRPDAAAAAAPPAPAAAAAERARSADIVWLDGGRSWCGTTRPLIPSDGEERRETRVRPFGIERFAVTNRRFAEFVAATGYRTEAETFGWSFVFADHLTPELRADTQRVVATPWWHRVDGADWQHPSGPLTGLYGLDDHPVVHVGWTDALAFAAWAGGRLPSEQEWEFAARGGRDVVYPWGDDDPPDDAPRCNNWQGRFPQQNLAADGYAGTAPVGSFEPNAFGLHDLAGNAWEWCSDAFRVRSLSAAGKARDREAREADEKVLKGGSYLCHRSYCHRYRIAARMGRPPDTSTGHIGFRLCYDPPARSASV
jgi:formylglycine-generating enzyme required for sulfatase activity